MTLVSKNVKMLKYSCIIIGSILLFFIIIALDIYNTTTNFLSKNQKVISNTLLIEGWLPDQVLDFVVNEYHHGNYEHIITTGIELPEYFGMYVRGFLIFDLRNLEPKANSAEQSHLIKIIAKSSTPKIAGAKFDLWINDSVASEYVTDTPEKSYNFTWMGNIKNIDSLLIYFKNDGKYLNIDRNLFIKEIQIDGIVISPYSENAYSDLKNLDNLQRTRNNYYSYAGFAAKGLIKRGVSPDKILILPTSKDVKYRTMATARDFSDWYKKKNIEIIGINIISLGPHSRRTWMSYNKFLNSNSIPVGIISIPDDKTKNTKFNKNAYCFKQLTAYIFYSIYFLFISN